MKSIGLQKLTVWKHLNAPSNKIKETKLSNLCGDVEQQVVNISRGHEATLPGDHYAHTYEFTPLIKGPLE